MLGVQLSISDNGGPGLPLLCLHAAGHGSADYGPLRDRVADRVRIVTVDWPSHGLSADDPVAANANRYAELTVAAADTLGIERFALLGCSVGGAAALKVAAAHPSRVTALVLSDAGGLAAPNVAIRSFCRSMAWAYRAGARGAWWFRYFFAAKYRLLLRGQARPQRRHIVAAGYEHAAVLATLWRSFAEPDNDARPAIDRVRCPVWLAWAKHDPFNNHHLIAAALRRFDAKLTLFPGGHAPFLEAPDAFATDLRSFLTDTDALG